MPLSCPSVAPGVVEAHADAVLFGEVHRHLVTQPAFSYRQTDYHLEIEAIRGSGVSRPGSCQAWPEPGAKRLEAHPPVGYGDDEIVDGLVVRDGEDISAARDQQFHQKPGGSLVAVREAVIGDHALQKRRSAKPWFWLM